MSNYPGSQNDPDNDNGRALRIGMSLAAIILSLYAIFGE